MGRIYLGLDIGTTSAKCLAVDENGETLALAQYVYPMTHPHQGWAEQDPEDYWRALVSTIRQCMRECKSRPIGGMAMSTQGDTLIVTDESGKPLLPAISWMDARGQAEYEELLAEADASFWYRETGSPMNALSSACAIRWITRNRPDITAANPRFCYVADYLAKRLCGRFVTDVPSASWTPLFSPSRRAWSQPVLDLLGVPMDRLPEVMESGETIGELLPDVAAELGVPVGTRLVAGAFDQAAAALGAGASANGTSVLSCGTAWVLYAVSSGAVVDASERLCTCCHTGAGQCGLVLPFTGGSAYDWLNRTLGDTSDDYGTNADSLVFVPHLYGGLSPDWRPESKGSLLGLTLAHTAGDIRIALMRGIAFEAKRNLEAAEALSGKVRSIRMVGGAGKSRTWPQMIANALGRPVEVSECVESACRGAAKLAAGEVSAQWEDTQPTRRFEPVADEVETEKRLYTKYLRAYEAMLGLYEAKG